MGVKVLQIFIIYKHVILNRLNVTKKNRDSLISNSKLPIVLHKVCVPVLITEIRKMFIANHLYIIQQVHSKTHNL